MREKSLAAKSLKEARELLKRFHVFSQRVYNANQQIGNTAAFSKSVFMHKKVWVDVLRIES